MADWEPPFANDNTAKRFQNATEALQGFGCGPVDLKLFDGLIHQIQAELGEVITWGGITHTNDRNTLVREAIQAKLTPFLKSVNSDIDGGVIAANGSRQFLLKMSNDIEWKLQLPAQPAGTSYLSAPVDILSVNQSKSGGDYDSGNVNLNLNTLSGVSVPAGATGVILQTATGVNGNQDRIGQSNTATFGYAWIQAGGTTSSTTFTNVGQASNLVSYSDTNLGGGDNDNTSYPLVKISGTSLTYRARVYWSSDFTGEDTGFLRIRLVGFTL